MSLRWTILVLALSFAGIARADERPYDAMHRSFGVYLDPADPLAWPDKVRAIARDEFHFWRGTRDLFYAWAGVHCRGWLSDPASYTVSHGDLHLGNIGSYASAAGWGKLAYGEVDFDESARLPFQLELVQCVVTFELIARDNGLKLTDADHTQLRQTIFDEYAAALSAGPTIGPADLGLATLMKDRPERDYAVDLDRFTHDGRFRQTVQKKGVVTDVLRRADASRRSAVARALAEAVQHSGRLGALLRPYDASDFQSSILDVAERTRLDSSGSQGLVKMLVLLRRPFRGVDHDGLIYLKQQIPSAAERAGIIPTVPGPAGRRYVRDLTTLTHGESLADSWCEIGDQSFWVSPKEPWGEQPDSKLIQSKAAWLNAARVLARVAADSHRADAARLRPLLTDAVRTQAAARAADYLAHEAALFADFSHDPRTAADVARAEAATSVARALARP